MSQSVPSTQVVSSVVTPAMPLPAQFTVDPFTGPSVTEDGVAAKARLVSRERVAKQTRAAILCLPVVALLVIFDTRYVLLRDSCGFLTLGIFVTTVALDWKGSAWAKVALLLPVVGLSQVFSWVGKYLHETSMERSRLGLP